VLIFLVVINKVTYILKINAFVQLLRFFYRFLGFLGQKILINT